MTLSKIAKIIPILFLAACGTAKQELPPPAPRADLCVYYTPHKISPAAAAVETIAALAAHASNEAAHYEHCITNHPALDPKRAGGPR